MFGFRAARLPPAWINFGPAAVLRFWREAGPTLWFAKDGGFDRRFRERFAPDHAAAAAGRLSAWRGTAEGALALVLLLDQYPRNAFRGSPRMYATDAQARAVADGAIRAGRDRLIETDLRLFLYLPFAHSEDRADQDRSVRLMETLGPKMTDRARHHRDIVARFGRFPHRNAILGREMTGEESQWLAAGGYSG